MRSFLSIVRTTALEILSEPLSLLVFLATLTVAVLAPAFHYHQFGEPTRMARDAGFSALLTGGSVIAVFLTIRTFRREIESRTLEMVLSHPVSRAQFFLAKTVGALTAYLGCAAMVFLVSLTVVEGAAVGGEIASRTGDVARIWGPALAAAVGVIVFPLVVGAGLNRFGRCRFVLSTFLVAALLSVLCGGWVVVRDAALAVRMASVALPIVFFSVLLLLCSAAFSVRLAAAAAAAAVGVVTALLVPVLGNYYLADALSNGGSASWGYVGLLALVSAPAAGLFVLAGIAFVGKRDFS